MRRGLVPLLLAAQLLGGAAWADYVSLRTTDWTTPDAGGAYLSGNLLLGGSLGIGIGSATPSSRLHVKSSAGQAAGLILDTTDTSGAGRLSYISFRSQNVQKGWVGFATSLNEDVSLVNNRSDGGVRLYSGGITDPVFRAIGTGTVGNTLLLNTGRAGIGLPLEVAPNPPALPAARLEVRGEGTGASTYALKVGNSTQTSLLRVRDDGQVSLSSAYSGVARATGGVLSFGPIQWSDIANPAHNHSQITRPNLSTVALSADTEGRIGIGTLAPSTLLHLVAPAGQPGLLTLDTTDGTGDGSVSALLLQRGGVAKGWMGLGSQFNNEVSLYAGAADGGVSFYTAGTRVFAAEGAGSLPDTLHLKSGKVGVGLASPGARLTVKGLGAGASTTALAVTDSADGTLFAVRDDGQVSVGSTRSGIARATAGVLSFGQVAWTDLADPPSTFTPSAHTHSWANITDPPATYAPSPHDHSRVTPPGSSTAALSVDTEGRVGIGTSTPSEALHVKSKAGSPAVLALDTADGTGAARTGYVSLMNQGSLVGWMGLGSQFSNDISLSSRTPSGGVSLYTGQVDVPVFRAYGTGTVANTLALQAGRVGVGLVAPPQNSQDLPPPPAARLEVRGEGSGAGAATYALKVGDSAQAPLFSVRDDGQVSVAGTLSGVAKAANGVLSFGPIQWSDIANPPDPGSGGPHNHSQLTRPDLSTLALMVDTTGKVGIGTTGPSSMLQVTGPVGTPGVLTLNTTDARDAQTGGGLAYVRLMAQGAARGWMGFGTRFNDDLYLQNSQPNGGVGLSVGGVGRPALRVVGPGTVANTLYLQAGRVGVGVPAPTGPDPDRPPDPTPPVARLEVRGEGAGPEAAADTLAVADALSQPLLRVRDDGRVTVGSDPGFATYMARVTTTSSASSGVLKALPTDDGHAYLLEVRCLSHCADTVKSYVLYGTFKDTGTTVLSTGWPMGWADDGSYPLDVSLAPKSDGSGIEVRVNDPDPSQARTLVWGATIQVTDLSLAP